MIRECPSCHQKSIRFTKINLHPFKLPNLVHHTCSLCGKKIEIAHKNLWQIGIFVVSFVLAILITLGIGYAVNATSFSSPGGIIGLVIFYSTCAILFEWLFMRYAPLRVEKNN